MTGKYANVLLEEVSTLLWKGAIELVPGKEWDGYYSTYFLVPKMTGDLKPILNLKKLNLSVEKPTFKMETLMSVTRGLKSGDWMMSVDLKDAYFHVPFTRHHRIS